MEAAIGLGLDSFSMQGIADQLGVTAPALYSHVSGREEVLALVNATLRDRLQAFTSGATNWRDWLVDFARLVREQLAASASTLMVDPQGPGSAYRLGLGEPGLRLLIDEGLSPIDAGYALWLVFRVAITAGPEQATPFSGYVATTGRVLAPADTDLPATQAVHRALVASETHDTFDFDLTIVLDGIAQRLAAAASSSPSSSPTSSAPPDRTTP